MCKNFSLGFKFRNVSYTLRCSRTKLTNKNLRTMTSTILKKPSGASHWTQQLSDIQVSQNSARSQSVLCFSSLWHKVMRLLSITSAPSSEIVFHHFHTKFWDCFQPLWLQLGPKFQRNSFRSWARNLALTGRPTETSIWFRSFPEFLRVTDDYQRSLMLSNWWYECHIYVISLSS
jgi:hypothetical protein